MLACSSRVFRVGYCRLSASSPAARQDQEKTGTATRVEDCKSDESYPSRLPWTDRICRQRVSINKLLYRALRPMGITDCCVNALKQRFGDWVKSNAMFGGRCERREAGEEWSWDGHSTNGIWSCSILVSKSAVGRQKCSDPVGDLCNPADMST